MNDCWGWVGGISNLLIVDIRWVMDDRFVFRDKVLDRKRLVGINF